MAEHLIEVEDLVVQFKQKNKKRFSLKTEYFSAVDHVNFSINKGETYGLVGESGSGKSTIGKAILRYHHPSSGKILFHGNDITNLNDEELLPYRKKMQSVFQDPYSSLDPSMTVSEIICEPMEIHQLYTKAERKERAAELIETVGLTKKICLSIHMSSAEDRGSAFPSQEPYPFSLSLCFAMSQSLHWTSLYRHKL